MRKLKTILVLAALVAHPALAGPVDIAFLGDNARLSLLKQCGADCTLGRHVVGTPSRESTASDVANLAQHAKHAVIVVDATQGPLPITREHIQIARQAGIPSLSMMFVNMAGLDGMRDAGELVELVELEVREVMNAYAMNGDTAMVFHDSRIKAIRNLHTNGVGLRQVLERTAALEPRKELAVEYRSGDKLHSYVYSLTPEESRFTVPLRSGSSITLWVNGEVARGTVSTGVLNPGENGELVLRLTSAVRAAEGSRFLLEREGRIVGMGVVVRVRS